MNKKAFVVFESIKNNKSFQYHMEVGAQWDEALLAAAEIFNSLKEHVVNLQKNDNIASECKPECKENEDCCKEQIKEDQGGK